MKKHFAKLRFEEVLIIKDFVVFLYYTIMVHYDIAEMLLR
jgi:hypothetical protein